MAKDRYREGWSKGYQQCQLDMTNNSKSALSGGLSLQPVKKENKLSKWIRVEEELPNPGQPIIMYSENNLE